MLYFQGMPSTHSNGQFGVGAVENAPPSLGLLLSPAKGSWELHLVQLEPLHTGPLREGFTHVHTYFCMCFCVYTLNTHTVAICLETVEF